MRSIIFVLSCEKPGTDQEAKKEEKYTKQKQKEGEHHLFYSGKLPSRNGLHVSTSKATVGMKAVVRLVTANHDKRSQKAVENKRHNARGDALFPKWQISESIPVPHERKDHESGHSIDFCEHPIATLRTSQLLFPARGACVCLVNFPD